MKFQSNQTENVLMFLHDILVIINPDSLQLTMNLSDEDYTAITEFLHEIEHTDESIEIHGIDNCELRYDANTDWIKLTCDEVPGWKWHVTPEDMHKVLASR